MITTTVLNKMAVNCGTVPVGFGVQVSEWTPTENPTYAILAKDCPSPAYVGLLGAVNAVPIVGVTARVVAEEGAKLLDMRFITEAGTDVGGFDVRYENGQIIYPWVTSIPDIDLSDIENRLTIIETECCGNIPDVSGFLTADALSTYATKTYVTETMSAYSVSLVQDAVNETVLNTYTRGSGYADGGIIFTDRSSIMSTPSPSTSSWGGGLTAVKTKNVDGTTVSVISPLQGTGAEFCTQDTNTFVSPVFYRKCGIQGYAPSTTAPSYGVRGFLTDAAFPVTVKAGSEGVLGFKEISGKVWAGAFFGDVYIGGDAVLIGTATGWPDDVFENNYFLEPFESRLFNQFVKKRLKGMPSQEDIASGGLNVFEIVKGLVRHVEELYLYIGELYDRHK